MLENDTSETNRRRFTELAIYGAVAVPAFMTATEQLGTSMGKQATQKPETSNRIEQLSLSTAVPLAEMSAFYRDILEMKVELSERKLVIDAGATQIVFVPAADGTEPYYHFAFNIPENKILSARDWLGDRTKLAVTPPNSRVKGYPNEVVAFDFWNSHSIYFWDPAGNILEFICRHDMKNGTKGEFRQDEILYASEIGLVTEGSVNELAGQIQSTFQLSQYRGGGNGFRAIGDETGLLILFSSGGTPIGAQPGQTWQTFPTNVIVNPKIELEPKNLPFSIKTI